MLETIRSCALVLVGLLATSVWADSPHRVLILGDSLTEGYGVAKGDSFPSVLERDLHSHGHPSTQVINAGISGSTSAGAASRLQWGLQSKPDILVLALGANDALRGVSPQETRKNLETAVRMARRKGIRVLIAGMKAPPNYGKAYAKSFESVFHEVARAEKVSLIPFLLQGVAGVPSLNQPDGIHPNEEGQKIVAKTVEKYLEPLL